MGADRDFVWYQRRGIFALGLCICAWAIFADELPLLIPGFFGLLIGGVAIRAEGREKS